MNFKNTIAVLSNDISEVKKLIDSFSNQNSVSNIELDLSLEKLRKIYDVLLLLKNDEVKTPEVVTSKQETNQLEEIKEIKQPVTNVVEPEIVPQVQPQVTIPEPPVENSPEVILEVENTVAEPTVEKEKDQGIKTSVIGEKAGKSKDFLNETFTQKHPVNDFSARQQTKPVSDLNKAIGINDKFLFINELFNGDSQSYKKAVEYINSCANFNEAFSYISDNLHWEMENEYVQKMLDLVRRKFITGENV